MGFTKLDENIIFSSIMNEDDSVFRVWIILLATCKSDGISPITIPFLSTITKKPMEEIERCIYTLESPDKNSRTKDNEGRRIERVNGGFKLLNYQLYREVSKTDYLREKQRNYRDKSSSIDTVPIPSASISSSLSSSNLLKRSNDFKDEVYAHKEYSESLLTDFFEYWSEPTKSKHKMRFELQETWDLSRRLRTWERRSKDNYKKQTVISREESYAQYKLEKQEREAELARARNAVRDGQGTQSVGDILKGMGL